MNEKNEKSRIDKIITGLLIAVIIAAVGIFSYVNLPWQAEKKQNLAETPIAETILTVVYGDKQVNYTLEELETLQSYTGRGGYRTSFPSIKGPYEYTGVPVTTLVEKIDNISGNYSLKIVDKDGEEQTYNFSVIQGNVAIYNASDPNNETPLGYDDVTMILAYKQDGEYLNASRDGRLRIAFVNDKGSITASRLWWKFVVSIEIIPESS
ncbi:MAG: hypothetical protein DRN08_04650 [Thermoplasmata archaeon]|nr:MAG: hypothetical protein DRN08_04650 [Thermoplasmata archaeon]